MGTAEYELCPMPLGADAPADEHLAHILSRARRVAVVGASPNPDRTSHQIAVWLMQNTPYEIYLVNPRGGDADVLGHGFYSDLASLPVRPDIVDVFRAPENVPPIADEAAEIGAMTLWLQLGVRSEYAADMARTVGMDFVQNRCIKVEYRRLADRIEVARAVHH